MCSRGRRCSCPPADRFWCAFPLCSRPRYTVPGLKLDPATVDIDSREHGVRQIRSAMGRTQRARGRAWRWRWLAAGDRARRGSWRRRRAAGGARSALAAAWRAAGVLRGVLPGLGLALGLATWSRGPAQWRRRARAHQANPGGDDVQDHLRAARAAPADAQRMGAKVDVIRKEDRSPHVAVAVRLERVGLQHAVQLEISPAWLRGTCVR